MNDSPNPIPEAYGNVTPYLIVSDGKEAIAFYKKVFGAVEKGRLSGADGTVRHAELCIGNSMIMIADECVAMGFKSPKSFGGTPVSICLYVEKSDAIFERAIAEGAKAIKPMADQFYGDRAGTVADPFGHIWTIASRIENVTMEEAERRATKLGYLN